MAGRVFAFARVVQVASEAEQDQCENEYADNSEHGIVSCGVCLRRRPGMKSSAATRQLNSLPVQDHLAGLTGTHGVKALLEFVHGKLVGNDR